MNIYVGNLSKQATEDDLREAFSQFGTVAEVSVMKNRDTGTPRGFAFVEMPNGQQAKTAINELDLTQIAERCITVSAARPRTEQRGGKGRRNRS